MFPQHCEQPGTETNMHDITSLFVKDLTYIFATLSKDIKIAAFVNIWTTET